MKAAQLKARETAFTSVGKYSHFLPMTLASSAHNEREKETIVKILQVQVQVQVQKITLILHSLQSAFCSLHGLRFNMTATIIIK